MSHLILPHGVCKMSYDQVKEMDDLIAERLADKRIKQLGPMGRLMTMLKNPSVPEGVKADLRTVDGELSALKFLAIMILEQSADITDALEVKLMTANPGEENGIAAKVFARWNKTAKIVNDLLTKEDGNERRIGK